MTPSLTFVETLARRAGSVLRSRYGSRHSVQIKKNLADLVTEVDRESEDVILSAIRREFPGDRIVSEESGVQAGLESGCWYVDPLDGTTNYAHGVPIFAVSIAWAQGGDLRLGAIYDPMLDEMFSAEKSRGAFLNGQPVRVSDTPTLGESLLVTGIPYELQNTASSNLDHFAAFSAATQGVRRLGSAALDQAYVACGRLDGYWEVRLQSWDIAAGILLVREAGGIVTNLHGSPEVLVPPYAILAANPAIHPLMLNVLHPAK